MKRILLIAFVLLTYSGAMAQGDIPSTTVKRNIFKNDLPIEATANPEFQFLAYFTTQGVTSNMYPQASLFNGQLVGRLFGPNSATTSDSLTSNYVEQRLIPFFIYQPKLFNGKAILRASFEIDWTWGDQSYGISGNKGSAFNADQVNIQTQNIEVELIPYKNWAINLGLQRLFDSPYNSYRVLAEKLLSTGYRLAYWGSDGVGVSARYDGDYTKVKGGAYVLYENNAELNDDVQLFELVGERKLNQNWNVGASAYYVADRGRGQGGPSVFGQGLNSLLAGYNGAFVFDLPNNNYKSDIFWLGAFFSRNPDFWNDRVQLAGFVNANLGSVSNLNSSKQWKHSADISGFAANVRGAYRIGQTQNDYVSLDYIYTSGDENALHDGKYSGVITGNTWGMPGAIFIGSGSLLLFPSGYVVSRFTPVVSDISNMGYGLSGGTINATYDFIPNRFNAKVGLASAVSAVTPQNGGSYMGTEINAGLKYTFGPYMSLELVGGYLKLGDFFDSNDTSHGSDINGPTVKRPTDPWTVILAYKWLMF